MIKPLVTIKALQKRMAQGAPNAACSEAAVRRMWWAALDTLQSDILLPMNLSRGLWLSSPLPALYEPKLIFKIQSGWLSVSVRGSVLMTTPNLNHNTNVT